jgi:cytochrome c nitrite reductase small subunit
MKKLIIWLIPPGQWKLPVIILSGIFAGLAVYIFVISNASSYLSDKPETCINCHVMNPQYATWQHSSHREVANCNDCHVPHNNFINKYFFKAKDGMRHATMFTLRLEPQVIQIKEAGKRVVHQNCIRCHGKLLEVPHMQSTIHSEYYADRIGRQCWDCHRETPHGRVNSLSAVPNARISQQGNPVPDWLLKHTQEQTIQQ